MGEPSGGLSVSGVSVTFGGLAALDDVSMSVDEGEVVGVIGPNGAGKTTLFNVVCGFVRPTAGRISYRGRLLRHHNPHDLAPLGIARTLQGVGLWPGMSVAENVMAGAQASLRTNFVSALLGTWRASGEEQRLRSRTMDLLDQLGVAEFADWPPTALPYAIQKRVALARALISEPTLLLLDEPASGLSGAEMEELRALIVRLRGSIGVMLVEHHMDLVMSTCDRLVVLNFGRVISAGTPEQVRADPEVTTAYLGEDVEAIRPGGAAAKHGEASQHLDAARGSEGDGGSGGPDSAGG
ncbi:MAG TPA: ABC transporter ATP-binding protein [Acidimicrobiales bacterium]|nr:ABC transporter ATP-binding protein [Acidimicrobiales bacterium]